MHYKEFMNSFERVYLNRKDTEGLSYAEMLKKYPLMSSFWNQQSVRKENPTGSFLLSTLIKIAHEGNHIPVVGSCLDTGSRLLFQEDIHLIDSPFIYTSALLNYMRHRQGLTQKQLYHEVFPKRTQKATLVNYAENPKKDSRLSNLNALFAMVNVCLECYVSLDAFASAPKIVLTDQVATDIYQHKKDILETYVRRMKRYSLCTKSTN